MNAETVTIGSTKLPWTVVAAALVALPIGAVIGVRTIKTRPASAFGQQVEKSSSFKPKEDAPVSGPALALVSQFNAEAGRGFGPSPMINKAPPPPLKPAPQDTVTRVQPAPKSGPAQAPPPPDLQVTSIMAANNGQMMAVINGKLRRVGDSVGNGFSITSISRTSGEVLITNDSGSQASFLLKKRSDN